MLAVKLYRVAILFVLNLVVWIGLILVDPLGSYTFISNKTATIFAQARAPFYGNGDKLARDNISIVLLTDDAARNYPTYPLSSDDYASILADIIRYEPLAIFIDVGFDDLHRKQANFVDQMLLSLKDATAGDGLSATTIPLVFAVDNLKSNSDRLSISDATEIRLQKRFPIYQVPVRQQATDPGVYQLRFPETQASGSAVDRSAAFLLFSLACPRLSLTATDGAKSCPSKISHDYDENLALQWGVEPSDSDKERVDCLHGGQDWFGHLLYSGTFLTLAGLPGLFNQTVLTQNCHYHDWLVTSDLDRPSAAAEVKARIRGRIVMLGIYDGIKDMHPTPFGPVGGVFVHAMALDNLLTYKASYFRELGPILHGSQWTWDRLYTLAAWSLISLQVSRILVLRPSEPRTRLGRLVGMMCGDENPEKPPSAGRAALKFGIETAVSLIFVVLAVWMSFMLRVRFSSVLIFTVLTPVLFRISLHLNKWLDTFSREKGSST